MNNVPVQVTNNDGFNSTLEAYKDSTFEVSGILGWDVIKRFNFKLDYKNRYLILDQKHSQFPPKIDPLFPLKIDPPFAN